MDASFTIGKGKSQGTKMIPKQQTFDTVVTHLRKQNAKSSDEDDDCFYRGPNGLKCAAGCLISDESYDPAMEGCKVECIGDLKHHVTKDGAYAKLGKALEGHDLNLVAKLQDIHDDRSIRKWEDCFRKLAKKHNLIYTPKQI